LWELQKHFCFRCMLQQWSMARVQNKMQKNKHTKVLITIYCKNQIKYYYNIIYSRKAAVDKTRNQ
jgi:hypothetical protein